MMFFPIPNGAPSSTLWSNLLKMFSAHGLCIYPAKMILWSWCVSGVSKSCTCKSWKSSEAPWIETHLGSWFDGEVHTFRPPCCHQQGANYRSYRSYRSGSWPHHSPAIEGLCGEYHWAWQNPTDHCWHAQAWRPSFLRVSGQSKQLRGWSQLQFNRT